MALINPVVGYEGTCVDSTQVFLCLDGARRGVAQSAAIALEV